jgi:hypothetical protein
VFVLPPESPAAHATHSHLHPGAEIPFSVIQRSVRRCCSSISVWSRQRKARAKLLFGEGVGPVPVVVRDGAPRFAQLTTAKLPEQGPGASFA